MTPLLLARTAAGTVSLVCLLLLVVSGWALMAGYVPSEDEAFASVLYWRQADGLGAVLRSLHYHLSSTLVVAGFVYLLATYLAGRHLRRRAWWLGVTLYLLILGLCFTGFLLPMDQNAHWGTVVRLGIVESSPGFGPAVADALRGGPTLNAATLPRFYALHTSILPFAALLLVLLLRSTAAWRRRPAPWLALALAVLVASYLVASLYPAPLELPADPTDSEYVPRPEWYFLWLFQFGKYVEQAPWIRSLILPVAGLGLLYLLPLLRRQGAGFRVTLAAGWCLAWSALTALAIRQDRELPPKLMYEQAMRIQAEEQYGEHCYDCHGEDGRGKGPQSRVFDLGTPDLSQEDVWLASSAAEMRATIRDGEGDDMPAFGNKLSPQQIDALVEYLETFRSPDRESVPKS